MESYSKWEMLILNLNYTCHVIPYLGYISDAAEIFRRLWKRTREFWNENLETISCVILSDSNDKLFLEFDCNFSMEKAKYLLGYKTYMLYNLDIRLESKKAYDAALFFLKKVGKVAYNLFSNVDWLVTKKTVKDFNQFIKLYLDKGFLPENVDVDIDDFLDSYEDTPQYKKLPKLEFLSEVSFPFNRVAPFKIADMFAIDEERIELSNLDEIYFQFRWLSISLLNARTIYDFGYKFKDELTEYCKEINFVFDNFSNEYLIETIKKIVAYFIKQFPLVTKISVEGEHLNLSKFFSLTQHIKEIDEENKIEISFDKPKDVSDQLNSDNEDDEDDLIYK